MAIDRVYIPQKRLNQIWDQVPPDYYDQGIAKNLLQRLWHKHKLKQVLSLVPKNAMRILDVGCASGVLTAQIQKHTPKSKVTGVDVYNKAVDFAKMKYPHIKFLVADAHSLPFRDREFDLVICSETLEHVRNPAKVLNEIKRLLADHGKAIVSMDSGSVLFRIVWYFWIRMKGKIWKNAHLHEFNSKILEDLIKRAGFTIKKKSFSHLGMSVTFLLSK